MEKESYYNLYPEDSLNYSSKECLQLLEQSKKNSEKVIKASRKENIYRFPYLLKYYNIEDDIFNELPKDIKSPESIEICKKAKEHFINLNNKYGIRVVPFEYVIDIDKDDEEPVLYCISDKIHGEKLLMAIKEFKSNKDIKELENLLISLIEYFDDKFYNDIDYLGDIDNFDNYMYGHKKGENENHIYLVDTEPVLYKLNSKQKREYFYRRMDDAIFKSGILKIETKLGINLINVREKYENFINGIERYLQK